MYRRLTPWVVTILAVAAISVWSAFPLREKIALGLDLQGGMHLVLEVDRSRLNTEEAKDAVERAMEVLRRRIDEFGVAEPLIQREGDERIAIQLPGLTDRQRAMDLIGKTALLEFKLVRSSDEGRSAWSRIDAFLAAKGAGAAAGVDTALHRAPSAPSSPRSTTPPSCARTTSPRSSACWRLPGSIRSSRPTHRSSGARRTRARVA